jgi:high affinity Mn2+ porin
MKQLQRLTLFIAALGTAALTVRAAQPDATASAPTPTGGVQGGTEAPSTTDNIFSRDFPAIEKLLGSAFSTSSPTDDKSSTIQDQRWNLHFQNTEIFQGDLPFPAKYTGVHSLNPAGENRETVSADIMAGVRLWTGAELHMDGLYWQGFGLSNTVGLAGVNNGEAFRVGTNQGNVNLARVFIRQTFGLGGEQEDVPDDQLHLAGKQDVSRITLTIGRMSAKDIFDGNTYANDPRTQFMNWTLLANGAWDFPADALGFTTGEVIELNQKKWTLRYGLFQVPKNQNGTATDLNVLEGWHMVTEYERRFSISEHPGVVRLLAFLAHTHADSFQDALDDPIRPAVTTHDGYTYKYGFGLNVEQEIIKDVGAFARLGWNDGKTEEWQFTDADRHASLGLSIKGSFWNRPNDTFGLAGVVNGISPIHRAFLAAGGLGIDTGDGNLNYGAEKILETYYDVQVTKNLHIAFDYQFVSDPAYNQDRGPVHVLAGRIHLDF